MFSKLKFSASLLAVVLIIALYLVMPGNSKAYEYRCINYGCSGPDWCSGDDAVIDMFCAFIACYTNGRQTAFVTCIPPV